MCSLRRFLLVAAVMAAMAVWCPTGALAGQGWTWPLDGQRVLGFGATYQASDGTANVHGGLDIAGGSGSHVRACASGDVVFAGKVPAGEGAQAFAVTILTADGLRVTLLPLSSVTVGSGSRVEAGDTVGVLAPAGDASSGATHLHLGVKRGSTRLDPASFLADAVSESPAPAPSVSSAPVAVPRVSGASAPGARAAAGPAPSTAAGAAPAIGSASAPVLALGRTPVSARDTLSSAAHAAATALDAAPRLRRIPTFRTTRVLSMSRMWRDITDVRGALGRGVLATALALVAAGCVVAVVRTVGASAQQAGTALATVREEHS